MYYLVFEFWIKIDSVFKGAYLCTLFFLAII